MTSPTVAGAVKRLLITPMCGEVLDHLTRERHSRRKYQKRVKDSAEGQNTVGTRRTYGGDVWWPGTKGSNDTLTVNYSSFDS